MEGGFIIRLCSWHIIIIDLWKLDWLIDWFPFISSSHSLYLSAYHRRASNMLDIYIPLLVCGHVSMHFYFVRTCQTHTNNTVLWASYYYFFHQTLFLDLSMLFYVDLAHDFWALPDILSCASILLYCSILWPVDSPSLPLLLLLQQQCWGETSLFMPSTDLGKMYTWRENAGSQSRHKSNRTKCYLIVFQSDCSNPYPAQQSTQVPVSTVSTNAWHYPTF